MLRNICYIVYLFLVVFISQFVVIIPYYLLRILCFRGAARFFMATAGKLIHRLIVGGTGTRVEKRGLENLPVSEKNLCFFSNHQSYFDIPLIFGYLPIEAGFVAKGELRKFPLLNVWISAIGSVYLDRKSGRAAIEAMRRGVELIKSGHPLVIFPEGTRSRGPEMQRFKPGSVKLALRSEAIVVPITVNHTYKIFEENGRVRSADVIVTVHPPIDTRKLDEEGKKGLTQELERIIASAL